MKIFSIVYLILFAVVAVWAIFALIGAILFLKAAFLTAALAVAVFCFGHLMDL